MYGLSIICAAMSIFLVYHLECLAPRTFDEIPEIFMVTPALGMITAIMMIAITKHENECAEEVVEYQVTRKRTKRFGF
ncbi:hypothetical protein WCWAEYFT_CDS0321 [Vibrio phage VB_VaC_TDDLMA]